MIKRASSSNGKNPLESFDKLTDYAVKAFYFVKKTSQVKRYCLQ